jgi:CBS domain-containing protein
LDTPPETQQPRHASRHPPPPPSVRAQGAAWNRARLEVSGRPRLAQDLMTRKIFTIGQDDSLAHLERQMRELRFRHLPVVEGNKLIGLITRGDLLRVASSFLSDKAKEQDALIHRIPAKLIMQRDLITVRPTHPLSEVTVIMWEAKIGCVPVTDNDKTLLGIITETDFVRLAHRFLSQRDERAG